MHGFDLPSATSVTLAVMLWKGYSADLTLGETNVGPTNIFSTVLFGRKGYIVVSHAKLQGVLLGFRALAERLA
jgi:hypothetical protein